MSSIKKREDKITSLIDEIKDAAKVIIKRSTKDYTIPFTSFMVKEEDGEYANEYYSSIDSFLNRIVEEVRFLIEDYDLYTEREYIEAVEELEKTLKQIKEDGLSSAFGLTIAVIKQL